MLHTWTRIPALGVNTGERIGALGIDGTLWPALGRCSDVAFEAHAGGNLIEGTTSSVRNAGVVEARIDRSTFGCCDWN